VVPKNNYQLKKWKGKFGQKYTKRNALSLPKVEAVYRKNFGFSRTKLNNEFLKNIDKRFRILEVGSNIGIQLQLLHKLGFKSLYGIEPQNYARLIAKKRYPHLEIIRGNIFDIPFKDNFFGLVFTSGVLIHINPKNIKDSLKEIYRCTKKYIWGYEYYSHSYKQIGYRKKKNLLWKGDFVKLYLDEFLDLNLVKRKKLKYLNNENVDEMFLLEKT